MTEQEISDWAIVAAFVCKPAKLTSADTICLLTSILRKPGVRPTKQSAIAQLETFITSIRELTPQKYSEAYFPVGFSSPNTHDLGEIRHIHVTFDRVIDSL